MDELKILVDTIQLEVNDFLVNALKEKAPKSAWQRARKITFSLQKKFKQFRQMTVELSKVTKGE